MSNIANIAHKATVTGLVGLGVSIRAPGASPSPA